MTANGPDSRSTFPSELSMTQLFAALVEKSPETLLLIDQTGTILYVNAAVERLLGYRREALIGQVACFYLSADEREHYQQSFQEALRAGQQTFSFQLRLRHVYGSWLWVECLLSNVIDDAGMQVISCVLHDITQRRQVEQELRASELRYRMVVEHSSDLIVLLDRDIHWLYISPSVGRILGYSVAELTLIDPFALIHPEDLSVLKESLRPAVVGQLGRVICRCLHKNGTWIFLEIRGTGIFATQGELAFFIFTSHDVTEQVNIDQRKEEFLSMTSHELRGPLTTMKASLQLAQRHLRCLPDAPLEDVSARVTDMLKMAERHLTLETRLVNDLLDVSRIQQSKLDLHLKLCSLLGLLRDVTADFQAIEQQRSIYLNVPDDLDMVPVTIDIDRIGQVLSNYLMNAVKYSPAEQPIEVHLSVEKDARGRPALARVAVQDHGPGLDDEDKRRIWERFYQSPGRILHKGSTGLGLGLYICSSIIQEHRGRVGVEGEPGLGATFWFTLPLVVE